ncbi:hypothetical protein P171DRAFT_525473 [Karstenula rhodostoma CBS 690.94]|uniref:C2 domain-containing protein n=1 Tax=Karstenula rhodostoma CBS 690.94 TaxID=1392251 RepID=A0A9P4PA41_9PLEO|nr:hypothetical protein P171DRAFT_525473 [Karstenula rhodostoma CBS 690.94]
MAGTQVMKPAALGAQHTAGIYSDMTVDGPVIGTLVTIIDRAKNLPNRRSMGKQDPYCAARLGKEAKKTATDRRGGQTPRWDQELRFTVHDSADYHQLKVSVFNDDKKTELIGETWVNLEAVIIPGGGQSDTWHGLNCRGKYAGEIRIELTYYDTRPKEDKPPPERKQPTARPGGSPAVGGPRESTPVKRRPLPSDPTGASSPSPLNTAEQRGLRGLQAGPRSYGSPRHEHTPSKSRPSQQADTPPRRPLPGASPMNETPPSKQRTPQQQPPASWPAEHDAYHTPPPNPRSSNSSIQQYNEHDAYRTPPPNPRSSSSSIQQYNENAFDMSYAAPKLYEVKPIDTHAGNRAMSQDNLRAARRQSYNPPPDLTHSYSAPAVPHAYEPEPIQDAYHAEPAYSNPRTPQQSDMHGRDAVQDPSYHVEPLRLSRNSRGQEPVAAHEQFHSPNGYGDSQSPYGHQHSSHGRRASAMQPTVEDEDDPPPPPPVHRKGANTLPQPKHQPQDYRGDAPAPLNTSRYREEPSQYGYDTSLQAYGANEYNQVVPQERRYTHPHPVSRPVSRDTMAPSPLRNETAMIPASLVPGLDARHSRDLSNYQGPPPSYEQPSRTRQLSEPDYWNLPQYDAPSRPHPLAHHQSAIESPQYYPHAPPEEPRRRSPTQDIALVRPRAISPSVSPTNAHSPANDRSSRVPQRSMPTRKSVSPRPPPPSDEKQERRLSAVPFDPDSFDVYNPNARSSSADPDRPGSSMEMNDQGQVVTFSGRVIDASDHLPIDSWAPEPERKPTEKVRPVRSRAALNGARDLDAAAQREERYRRERADRDRIRDAANVTFGAPASSPSNALVISRHNFNEHSYDDYNSPVNAGALVLAGRGATPPSSGRNRLQKRDNRPMSSYDSPSAHSPSNIPMPHTNVLRERENVGGYGGSPGYGGGRHSGAAPPIPAKVPLEHGGDDMALSLELQSIDIGPGSAGRRTRGTTRRNYGF